MELFVTQQFTPQVQEELLGRYQIPVADCTALGGFENLVFKVKYHGEDHIFRVSHGTHRNAAELRGELDYIQLLKNRGLRTPAIIPSAHGNLLESTGDGENDFHAVLFEHAPGRMTTREDWDADFYYTWGKTMGWMHRQVQDYQPSAAIRRPEWNEDELVRNLKGYLPPDLAYMGEEFDALCAEMADWSTDVSVYGLVHADLHGRNFFWHEGEIIPFDFDDALYHWYIYDIMVILYSVTAQWPGRSYRKQAEIMLPAFLGGYGSEMSIPDEELKKLPKLLRYRDLLLAAVLHKKLGPDRFDERIRTIYEGVMARDRMGEQAYGI